MGRELLKIIGAGALGVIAAVTTPDSVQAASISDGTITEKPVIQKMLVYGRSQFYVPDIP